MPAGERSVGIFTTDRRLVVRSWDGWLADASGIPADIACGSPLGALFPEIAERGLIRRLRSVVDEDRVEVLAPALHQYLIPCSPRDPSPFFAHMQQHVTVSPLREGPEIVGIVARIEDVTPRRDRERALAERLKSGDEAARLRAVEALAASDASADVLIGAFRDASWRVRQVAVEAVARGEGELLSELLIRVLREQHRDLAVLNATLSAMAGAGEDITLGLLDLMESPDADLRVYVALALGHSGDERAVPGLIRSLRDPDPNVQFHALEALGRLRARAASPALLEIANSRDFSLSFAALDALGAIGDETVVPHLLPFLSDDLLAPAAVAALGKLGTEDAVAPLARLLASADADIAEVAEALAAIFARFAGDLGDGDLIADLTRAAIPPSGHERLTRALFAARDSDRAALMRVLSWLDFAGVDEVLLQGLSHPATRQAAVDGLVRRGSSAVDRLVAALDTLEGDARTGAVVALGRIGSPAAVPALLGLVDADPDSAAPIAAALASIGDARAVDPLIRLLDQPRATVRQAAIGALNSLGDPDMPARVVTLLDSPSARVRESAAKIAGYFAVPQCLDRMLALAHDDDDAVRRAAIEHLVYYDDSRTAGVLREALQAANPSVRAAVVRAAARLSPPEAAPLIGAALADPDLWVRYYAARSAGALRSQAQVPTLARLALHDRAVPVQIAAAQALGEIGAVESIPALSLLAGHDDPEISRAALCALASVPHPDAGLRLAESLRSGDPLLQRAVLDAVEGEVAVRLVDDIAHIARASKAPEVLRAAALALLRSGSPEGVRHLCLLAASPSRRGTCVDVLSRVPVDRLELLADPLRGGDEEARLALVSAVGRMTSPAAARLLAEALEDSSPAVRVAAAHALGRIDVREAQAKPGRLAGSDADLLVRQAEHDSPSR